MKSKNYICPVCKSKDLYLKHEASYVYSYLMDSDAPGIKNNEVFSPFLYDRRNQTSSLEYVECNNCKTRFQSNFLNNILNASASESPDYII